MTQQFTASEVRDAITWKYGDKLTRISAMLRAFADLLEAQEKAEPVAWMYPSDLKRFETSEATADAYSIQVCRPGEDTVALYAHPSEDVRDAKRYRWLSEHEDADLYMENPGKDALDAAIDAAMAKENGNAT